MSIYKRDDVLPDWEPVPWTSRGSKADDQEKGFHQRALKCIEWTRIDWDAVPSSGIFGQDEDWLRSRDISWYANHEGEQLFLIDNTWFEFPDPPRWGLVSRPVGKPDAQWKHWGHFPDLPKAWKLEKES